MSFSSSEADKYRGGTQFELDAPSNGRRRPQDHGTANTRRLTRRQLGEAPKRVLMAHPGLACWDGVQPNLELSGALLDVTDFDDHELALLLEAGWKIINGQGVFSTESDGFRVTIPERINHEREDELRGLASLMEEVPGGLHFGVIGDTGHNPRRAFLQTPQLDCETGVMALRKDFPDPDFDWQGYSIR